MSFIVLKTNLYLLKVEKYEYGQTKFVISTKFQNVNTYEYGHTVTSKILKYNECTRYIEPIGPSHCNCRYLCYSINLEAQISNLFILVHSSFFSVSDLLEVCSQLKIPSKCLFTWRHELWTSWGRGSYPTKNTASGWEFTKLLRQICKICNYKVLLRSRY